MACTVFGLPAEPCFGAADESYGEQDASWYTLSPLSNDPSQSLGRQGLKGLLLHEHMGSPHLYKAPANQLMNPQWKQIQQQDKQYFFTSADLQAQHSQKLHAT